MDINHLLAREQIALIRADEANDVAVRFAHIDIARMFGDRLKQSTYPHRTAPARAVPA